MYVWFLSALVRLTKHGKLMTSFAFTLAKHIWFNGCLSFKIEIFYLLLYPREDSFWYPFGVS